LYQNIKQKNSIVQSRPSSSDPNESASLIKIAREREEAMLKWKSKREEKLAESRMLDARQIATSKRERSNGKFAKRKINWVSITDVSSG